MAMAICKALSVKTNRLSAWSLSTTLPAVTQKAWYWVPALPGKPPLSFKRLASESVNITGSLYLPSLS
jgi:hypothetical protein